VSEEAIPYDQQPAAIVHAAKQVARAIFFSLAIIVVSFVPVFLLEAQEGRMFRPLAFTKTFAMVAASILSITLVPVLMTIFIRGKRLKPEGQNPISRFFTALYAPIIRLALGWKWTRHKWFLRTHLAATLFVVARVWIGLPCPLSAAENRLRLEVSSPCLFGQPMHDGLHRLAFRGKDPQGFATATTVFGAFVLAAFVCADRRLPKVREA